MGTGEAHGRKGSPKQSEMSATTETATKLVSFTINAQTARVVKLEGLDPGGGRHELSDDEKASLAEDVKADPIEEALEQAFEAGIACVLDTEVPLDRSSESAEDAELRHLLLTPLIAQSPAKRWMEREVLNRVILETLIEHSMDQRAASDRTTSTSRNDPHDTQEDSV